jgi:hypothetical protein
MSFGATHSIDVVSYRNEYGTHDSLIRDKGSRVEIIVPVLGVGANAKDRVRVHNKFGEYIGNWISEYDSDMVSDNTRSALTDLRYYRTRLSSECIIWDGFPFVVNKHDFILPKLKTMLNRADPRFPQGSFYALKDDPRRYGYKNGQIFYYKGDNLQYMKIGKAVKRLGKALGIETSDGEVQHVQNVIKGINAPAVLKVVEGADIRKYYLETRYAERQGTLSNSCMRYSNCQPYFDVYVENAKMLVLINESLDTIYGRALLWTATDGTKIMDRVYAKDENYHKFFDWAKENGYIRKEWQTYNNLTEWVGTDGTSCFRREYSINLGNLDDILYAPYMDTFAYVDVDSGLAYNHTNIPQPRGNIRSWRSTRGAR